MVGNGKNINIELAVENNVLVDKNNNIPIKGNRLSILLSGGCDVFFYPRLS